MLRHQKLSPLASTNFTWNAFAGLSPDRRSVKA
jgi:hypothetical protein